MIESTELRHNSKKACATIKKLNTVNQPQSHIAAVTPNQVAHQLLLNGKPKAKLRHHKKIKIPCEPSQEN